MNRFKRAFQGETNSQRTSTKQSSASDQASVTSRSSPCSGSSHWLDGGNASSQPRQSRVPVSSSSTRASEREEVMSVGPGTSSSCGSKSYDHVDAVEALSGRSSERAHSAVDHDGQTESQPTQPLTPHSTNHRRSLGTASHTSGEYTCVSHGQKHPGSVSFSPPPSPDATFPRSSGLPLITEPSPSTELREKSRASDDRSDPVRVWRFAPPAPLSSDARAVVPGAASSGKRPLSPPSADFSDNDGRKSDANALYEHMTASTEADAAADGPEQPLTEKAMKAHKASERSPRHAALEATPLRRQRNDISAGNKSADNGEGGVERILKTVSSPTEEDDSASAKTSLQRRETPTRTRLNGDDQALSTKPLSDPPRSDDIIDEAFGVSLAMTPSHFNGATEDHIHFDELSTMEDTTATSAAAKIRMIKCRQLCVREGIERTYSRLLQLDNVFKARADAERLLASASSLLCEMDIETDSPNEVMSDGVH